MKKLLSLIAVYALMLAIPVALWVFLAKMEANAYNRVTGANISTWDAMWIQLRVDGKSK